MDTAEKRNLPDLPSKGIYLDVPAEEVLKRGKGNLALRNSPEVDQRSFLLLEKGKAYGIVRFGQRVQSRKRLLWPMKVLHKFEEPLATDAPEDAHGVVEVTISKASSYSAGGKKKPKKRKKKGLTKAQAVKLMMEVGPPIEWSGGVAGFLGSETIRELKSAWNALSKDERKTVKAKFHENMDRLSKNVITLTEKRKIEHILSGEMSLLVDVLPEAFEKGTFTLAGPDGYYGTIRIGKKEFLNERTLLEREEATGISKGDLESRRASHPQWREPPYFGWPFKVVKTFAAPITRNSKAPDEGPDDLNPVLKRLGLAADPEGGIHAHGLIRAEKRTHQDGNHLHVFELPGGSLVVTREDGQHQHGLSSENADTSEAGVSGHQHTVILEAGEILDTAKGGEHEHDLQVNATAFDGSHQHELELPDGTVVTSLSPGEFWEKFGDPEMDLGPAPDAIELSKSYPACLEGRGCAGPLAGVLQYHFTEKGCWLDFRIRKSEEGLAGWTIDIARPGAFRTDVATMRVATGIARTWSPLGDRWSDPLISKSATPKLIQPEIWLDIEGGVEGDGQVGANDATPGLVAPVDKMAVEYGLHTDELQEFFVTKSERLNGILRFEKGAGLWQATFEGENLVPAVLKSGAEMPPDGHSGLPLLLEAEVPAEHRYWLHKGEDAQKVRDALIATGYFSSENVKLVNKELRRVNMKWTVQSKTMLGLEQIPEQEAPAIPDTEDPIEKAISLVRTDSSVVDLRKDGSALSGIRALNSDKDYLLVNDDSPENRASMIELGRPFILKGHSGLLFVSSAPPNKTSDVEWADDGGSTTVLTEKRCEIVKADTQGEERFVLGVVLEPETVDAQDDIYSPEVIRESAHKFMAEFRNIGFMHEGVINDKAQILESYIAPVDFELNGQTIKAGTWMLATKILDDGLWMAIKAGEITGYSIGGTAVRKPRF